MGRCYDNRGRLVCDGCGVAGGVRRRTCPHRVHYPEGGSLPYCGGPDLCDVCAKRERAEGKLHAGCAEGARRRTEEEAARGARLRAGGFESRTGWGPWSPTVPAGYVGRRFVAMDGREAFRLVPDAVDAYIRRSTAFLDDYERAAAALGVELLPWSDPDAVAVR